MFSMLIDIDKKVTIIPKYEADLRIQDDVLDVLDEMVITSSKEGSVFTSFFSKQYTLPLTVNFVGDNDREACTEKARALIISNK